jgi:hypothetical protein
MLSPSSTSSELQHASLNLPVTGELADGGTFTGVLDITNMALNEAGQLVASGTLTGTATSAGGIVSEITQSFTDVVLGLLGGRPGRCTILTLDLGPLHLDLLGLVVDLAPVELDVTAERGPGKLLGNLLCAVAGLLDNPGGALSGLLRQINRILGSL